MCLGDSLPRCVLPARAFHLNVQRSLHVGRVTEKLVGGGTELPSILKMKNKKEMCSVNWKRWSVENYLVGSHEEKQIQQTNQEITDRRLLNNTKHLTNQCVRLEKQHDKHVTANDLHPLLQSSFCRHLALQCGPAPLHRSPGHLYLNKYDHRVGCLWPNSWDPNIVAVDCFCRQRSERQEEEGVSERNVWTGHDVIL